MSRDYVPLDEKPERRIGLRTLGIVGIVAFLIGAIAIGYAIKNYGHWFEGQPTPVKTRSSAMQPAVPDDDAIAAPSATSTDLNSLNAREAALAARLADLEARAATIDTKAEQAGGNATRAEGMLVAFAARRALDRGLGLGYVEGQLRQRFGATQPRAVATIIQASRNPVTADDLRLGLTSIGSDLVSGGDTKGWFDRLRDELSSLVVIHKEGTLSSRPSDRLARARYLIEAGQVESALAEVRRLPGAPRADRWIAAAQRYVDSRRALDVIETAAILGQGGPAVPTVGAAAPAAADQTPPALPVAEPDAAAATAQ
ncbi:hypothetical protein DFR49_2466 [Hephaestia caeni]|uniref:Inner membrane protein n=1 Tax=Hephaestia caeni TaxID=645617 RepID=A0A397PAN5_9SPHN|nr:hypothetical protein [Hephaestia caeni]RIA44227.1 hypothetical protein DFR49_2466 [Hephaestia caeni]